MGGPEDRESGAKPPEPASGQEPYLPARLREKLGDEEDTTGKKPGGFPGWIVWVVIVVVVAAGGWWFYNNHQAKVKAEAARAAREAAVADSLARIKTALDVADSRPKAKVARKARRTRAR